MESKTVRVKGEGLESFCMRWCLANGIKVIVGPKDSYSYMFYIDINGNKYYLNTVYKQKPRFKKDLVWYDEVYKIYYLLTLLENNVKQKTILQEAADIIYNRDSEKATQYGDFHESMKSAARIATEISGKQITGRDMYHCLIALKLSRLKNGPHYDSYLDLIAYIASVSDLRENDEKPGNILNYSILDIEEIGADDNAGSE